MFRENLAEFMWLTPSLLGYFPMRSGPAASHLGALIVNVMIVHWASRGRVSPISSGLRIATYSRSRT